MANTWNALWIRVSIKEREKKNFGKLDKKVQNVNERQKMSLQDDFYPSGIKNGLKPSCKTINFTLDDDL
jgi:hypothetical protein